MVRTYVAIMIADGRRRNLFESNIYFTLHSLNRRSF